MPKIQTYSPPPQQKTSSKGLPIGWIAVIALIVIVVGVVIWQAPALMAPFQSSDKDNQDYSQISLVSGISATYEHDKNVYVFSYRLNAADNSNLFYVSENAAQSRSYPAVAGAIYRDLNVEMKVVSVTSELLVLQVKPLTE